MTQKTTGPVRLSPAELSKAFDDLKPWVSKFVVDGVEYGGKFDPMRDVRVEQFLRAFPKMQSILELGSLEGGHTCALAMQPGVTRVVGIEGREQNVARAQLVRRIYGLDRVEFLVANLEDADLRPVGQFDATFCAGLLYHLPNPWSLIDRVSAVSRRLFLWTHYAPADSKIVLENGYRGRRYQEFGLADPLSGLSPTSFWPTLPDLKKMIRRAGFRRIKIIKDDPTHPNGPCVTLAASKWWWA